MGKTKKTNAMRILESENISYRLYTYDSKDGKIDGISVAEKIGLESKFVYKTLVLEGSNKEYYVYVIPVHKELDLKIAAKVAGEKKVELVPIKDIMKLTGYIRGGCSPIGMKKKYKTYLDNSAKEIDSIVVSGGKIGIQIELKVLELLKVTEGEFNYLTKE